MLKRNSRNIFLSPNKFTGLYTYMLGNSFEGGGRNAFLGGFSQYASIPASGYADVASWILPQKSGGGAAFKSMTGDLSCSASLSGGRNAEAALSAIVTNSADLALIIQMQANITADGNFTNAGLELLAQLSANILGQLTTTSAILEAIQILDAVASLSALGQLNAPTLGALLGAAANITSTMSVQSIEATGKGYMGGFSTATETLTKESIAQAVWAALIADNIEAGSTGEALNNVSGGSSPSVIADAVWNAAKTGYNIDGSMGDLAQDIHAEILKRLKTIDFIALK